MSAVSVPLPSARGPAGEALFDALRRSPEASPGPDVRVVERGALDPEDLHSALYCAYELHYRGFTDVDDAWEWAPALLAFRHHLEQAFLEDLRAHVPGGRDADAALAALTYVSPSPGGLGGHLRAEGTWEQMRETFAHRSLYHLKEADPHAWVIPRLQGNAKAAMVAVEFDEFGGGRGDRMHAQLFADLMAAAGLDDGYLAYLDRVPAEPLAIVNFMSMCGLHRSLRGALVGHFADVETTSSPGSRTMVEALQRMSAPDACVHFYAEHVEADAVHEQIVRHDVVGDLLAREPHLEPDVVFGIEATELLEQRLADRLIGSWRRAESSLLPAPVGV
ncbi:iron-containing redox enzyme family protein [Rhodococcus sp. HNM0569]|uniref:iron-containing redox enzyme family protein n=1 Tax=Rhodococcus sp. HNM0569 TaxID=2716340 RepID=UPI003211CF00